MKKLAFLPALLFPYTLFLALLCIRDGTVIERFFNGNGVLFRVLFLVWYAAAFLATLRLSKRLLREKCSTAQLMKAAWILKLSHIPAYAAFLLVGMSLMLSIFFAISVLLFLLGTMISVLSGLVGWAAVLRGEEEGFFTRRDVDVHGILLFFFGFDMYSIILLRRRLMALTDTDEKTEKAKD